MDLLKMIAELQIEKQRLDEAIEALERLSYANNRRRGRPTRWAKDDQNSAGASLLAIDGTGIDRKDAAEEIEATATDS